VSKVTIKLTKTGRFTLNGVDTGLYLEKIAPKKYYLKADGWSIGLCEWMTKGMALMAVQKIMVNTLKVKKI